MIIIEEIKTIEVEYDTWQRAHMMGDSHVRINEPPYNKPIEAITETIHGTRFRLPNRDKDVVIGMTTDVERFLGFTLEEFSRMSEQLTWQGEQLGKETLMRQGYEINYENVLKLSLWKRILSVFNPRVLRQ